MPSTPSLQIPHIAASDTSKYAKANTAITTFDAAFCANIVEQVGGSPYVDPLNISDADYDNNIVFFIQGTITSDAHVKFPSRPRFVIVCNQTTSSPPANLIFEVDDGSGGTVTIPQDGLLHALFVDSNPVFAVSNKRVVQVKFS